MRSLSAMGLACLAVVGAVVQTGCGDNLQLALVGGTGGTAGGTGKAGAGGTAAPGGHGGMTSMGGRGGTGAAGAAGAAGGSAGSAGGSAGAAGGSAGAAGTGGAAGGTAGAAGRGTGGVGGVGAVGGAGAIGGAGAMGGAGGGAGGRAGAGGGGTPPVITFVTPTAASKLCGAGNSKNGCIADADGTSAGWQGTITVHVTLDGAPVTTGNANLAIGGLAFTGKALDPSGNASFTGVSVPEGPAVNLSAATDNIPGRGVGTANFSLVVDTISPAVAPSALTVAPLSRRQTSFTLAWTAPLDVGQATVGGYDVHVKIANATTMDPCGTEVKTVPFMTVPKSAGGAETMTVSDLLIETSYCFTVAATDEVGNVGPSSPTGATARFNQALLSPPAGGPSNERFGYTLEGTGDYNGDGLSDLIVGDFSVPKVYLFLGSKPFASASPTTVITGSVSFFGFSLAPVGDIDGDGRDDFAIGSPQLGSGKVFIFKGRQTWPAALMESDADYTINTDASYMGGVFGSSIASLGDFNGDGVPDFAIGAYNYSGGIGRVVVVLGKTSGFSSITLPDAANTITVGGDASLPKGFFGYRVLGLGHYYPGTATTLVVAGIGQTGQPGSTGQVYAFRGQAGVAGAIANASADAKTVGPAANARIGYQLTNLGPIIGSLPGIGIGAPFYNSTAPVANGSGYIYTGDATVGPFGGRSWAISDSAATTTTDQFGSVLFGGGISGSDAFVSIVGDSKPDIAIMPSTQAGSSPSIYILDGRVLPSRTSPIDVAATADVKVGLPVGWAGTSSSGRGLVRDIDGDGYGDFAVGELAATIPGRVAVFW